MSLSKIGSATSLPIGTSEEDTTLIEHPPFMPFRIDRWNGERWVTAAFFADLAEAQECVEALVTPLHHYRLVDTQDTAR